MTDHAFPKSHRLLTSEEFDRVFAGKCSAADQLLVVYGAANDLTHPRLGLVVSRKVGKAVLRNRWKRLLREAFRLSREDLPASFDLVVIPRAGAQPALEPLKASLTRLAGRIARRGARKS